MKTYRKILGILIMMTAILWMASTYSNAAVSMSVRASTSEVKPGGSFQVTITVSGGAGYVNISASNGKVSSSKEWIDDSSKTITVTAGTSEGSTTVSVSGVIGDYTTEEDVSKSGSTTVSVKKEQPVIPPPTTPTETEKKEESTTNKNNNKTTTTKNDTKQKESVNPKEEEEEAAPEFCLTSLLLKGVKENKEEVEISLSPAFDSKTYEYTCQVDSSIKTITLLKEAGIYNDNVTVTGLEEPLKNGENSITIKMAKEGHTELTYTIKINRQEEVKQVIADVALQDNKQTAEIKMSIPSFLILQLALIAIEVVIIKYVPWNKIIEKIRK